MSTYRPTTSNGLRDVVVGSPVLVYSGGVDRSRRIRHVASVGKVKVRLDDGSVWARGGRAWGSGGDIGWFHSSADEILDLEAVKRDLHEERQARALDALRRTARSRFGDEVRTLTGKDLAAVIAILDAAREPKQEGVDAVPPSAESASTTTIESDRRNGSAG